MNKMEALKLMAEGKRVRVRDWVNNKFYFRISNNTIVDHLNCDSQEDFNLWKFDNDDIWEEYVGETWEWKVGDKFTLDDFIYEVIYIDEGVVFCKQYYSNCSLPCYGFAHFEINFLK